MKMPETALYTALVAKNAKQAAADMSKVLEVDIADYKDPGRPIRRRLKLVRPLLQRVPALPRAPPPWHGHLLVSPRHGLLLAEPLPERHLHGNPLDPQGQDHDHPGEVDRIARVQTLIALCGTVPGYWFTVFLINRVGQFWIQLCRFFFTTVFMLGLAFPYDHWTIPGKNIGFVILYGLTLFFANFGPNSTTFIMPAEIFR